MAASPRALLMAPETPYPTVGGGALRTASLVEYLAAHYELDVIVFRQPAAPDPAHTRLGRLTRRIAVLDLPIHSRHSAARALRNLTRLARGSPPLTDRFSGFSTEVATFVAGHAYDLALVDHFWCAPYLAILAPVANRTILDLHNIESVLHERCALSEPWPLSALHRRFQHACRRLEQSWLPRYDLVLTASDDDAERVRAIGVDSRTAVYPNSIPSRARPERPEEDVITFSGNMEYHPNSDAVHYFHRRIWPLIKVRWPRLTWELVGMNPNAVRRYVGDDPSVRLRGSVEDAITELARSKASVVPLRAGSGTRVKILEAWAAGTPVVSTSVGAEGLGAAHGRELLIADEPVAFADAVSSLLTSPPLGRELARAGRTLYEQRYTWEAGWRKLAGLGV